jgi:hypothetical protein
MKPTVSFVGITSEGGLLPTDFLSELLAPKSAIEGLAPQSYSLAEGERVSEQVNRSWVRLKGRWADFKKAIAAKQPGDPTTTETRDRWLHPIFQELGFGQRLAVAPPIEVDGRSYPVSHGWTHVPIHLVGSHADLDRRTPGAVGAAKASPHSLVQQALNASERHLWGIVCNGLTLRLLRDSVALTRLSYVEWDLSAIFDGDLYSEFFLLWLVCHQSRFEGERAEQCWLEQWKESAEDKGLRALKKLRPGVARAIEALGEGLVSRQGNKALCARLRSGELSTQGFYRQVLRVIYRMLFLFVAEDRDLLHPPLPGASATKEEVEWAHRARRRYREYYAITRLRGLTLHRSGTPHSDLWQVLQLLTQKLGSDAGCPELALPGLGSFLWDASRSTPDLADTMVSNRHLLTAVHALAFVEDGSVRRPIDYKNLGSEELGSVYEGLLELHPTVNADSGVFELNIAAGNERKTSGSFYTPDSLVQCLLDSALEPLMADIVRGMQGEDAAKALLKLKVCDPAVGSGHFLIAAAHRLAKRVAAARSGEEEPSPEATRTALRDVIGRCLYGVDVTPMSAELCRVSLWLEALEPGKPLSFLDHHIRVGNSLLGTTPELIAEGIPEGAFKVIEGDDGDACAALKKRNKGELLGFGGLFAKEDAALRDKLRQAAAAIDDIGDSRPYDIHRKEAAFQAAESNYDFQKARDLADLWCAAFVIKKSSPIPAGAESQPLQPTPALPAAASATQASLFGDIDDAPEPKAKGRKPSAPSPQTSTPPWGITTQHLRDFVEGGALPDGLLAAAKLLASHYQFFHWHLAFPEVAAQGGFDIMLGNPPWDTLSPDQREFFGKYVSGLRSMAPEEQETTINRLLGNPTIAAEWTVHCRELFAFVHFLKSSGVYTLYARGNLGKGDFNVYRMFVELVLRRIRLDGFGAMVVPGGLYGGANASAIRHHLFNECELRNIFGLINTTRGWFPEVDIDRFAAFAAKRGGRTSTISTKFGLSGPEDLSRMAVEIEAEPIRQLAPDTYAIPDLRNTSELTTSRKMYASCPTFGDRSQGPPFRHYSREVDMGNDRELFTDDPSGLPVYEGRMIDHFDHRAKTYQSGHGNSAVWVEREFGDSAKAIVPQWRVLPEKIPEKLGERCSQFRIGFGDVANPRNQRSFTATLIPPGVICGHKVPTFVFDAAHEWAYLPWLAVANSFTMDWLARCRLTAPTMSYTLLDSLPFPRPAFSDAFVQSVAPVVLRLVCTAPEMTPFWNRMAELGFVEPVTEGTVPPNALVEPNARATVRAELDAFIAARVFNLTAQELADLLDTFEAFRRSDQRAHKEFRTKRLILEAFAAGANLSQSSATSPTGRDSAPVSIPTMHLPTFDGQRFNFQAPGDYILPLVGSLLRHLGGGCDLMKLIRAYALLLGNRSPLLELAEARFGKEAGAWVKRFNQAVDGSWFLPIIRGLDNRDVVKLEERGESDVFVRLLDSNVPTNPTVETDVYLLLQVLDLNSVPPAAIAEQVKGIAPKPVRTALKEASALSIA